MLHNIIWTLELFSEVAGRFLGNHTAGCVIFYNTSEVKSKFREKTQQMVHFKSNEILVFCLAVCWKFKIQEALLIATEIAEMQPQL